MNQPEASLQETIVEGFAEEKIAFVIRVESVAVSDKEGFPVHFDFEHGGVQDHPTFLCQVVERPDVMISGKKMNFYPAVGEIGEFCQKAHVSFGNHVFVFEPEIEHITQQVELRANGFYLFQKIHEHQFPFPVIFQ